MTPKTDCGNLERCKIIFVSWQWAVVSMLGFVGIIVVTAWAGSARFTKIELKVAENEKAISILYENINSKLDSLLKK